MRHNFRPNPPGPTVFFTAALAERGGSLLVDRIDALRAAVGLTRREFPFYVDAWVVLPDHMHCVWTLAPGDTAFARRWQTIQQRFCDHLPRDPGQATPVWHEDVLERGVETLTDYAACVRKCWFDPVRHGLAKRPEDWGFSSVHLDGDAGRLVA